MSDTITPGSLRAHADYMERVHLDGISAAELLQEAARLEAEAARDDYVKQLAKVHRERMTELGLLTWDDMNEPAKAAHMAGIAAVLDRLAADGRLLPEGGTVLTAEQAENVRWLLGLLSDMSFTADRENESYKRLVALFPPPAVSVPDSEPEDPCGGTGTVECWNPGGLCTEKVCELCGPCRTCDPNAPILFANSGPDGTPENPWPTAADVPDGVRYWHGDGRPNPCLAYWVNQGGVRMHGDAALHEPIPSVIDDIDKFAPFVRVDGDKA
ncbi:hypothetical protein [Prescottella equi]|uniref:hypothetical protein n=1 Tax=Rhodococcus hoagii TaxID=43767 RepID=UPI0015852009|nr:hypothetical protein [Prescottella equi]